MANVQNTNRVPFGAVATYGVVQFVASLREKVTTWNHLRITRKALNALSDRELTDIGLTRADIDRVTRKQVY